MARLKVSEIFREGEKYRIITKYKEIPIKTNLKLNWTDDEGRLLGFDWGRTHLKGAFSTLDPVFVELSSSEYAVTNVFSNLGKELVLMLETFSEPPDFIKRRSVRVEPDENNPVEVLISLEEKQIKTSATDISETGIGIDLDDEKHREFINYIKAKINHIAEEDSPEFRLKITLPQCGEVSGLGKLKNIITRGKNIYARLGFEVSFGHKELNLIRRYVINRQKEIIKSLRML
jgi:hypothetical protein